MHVFLKKIVLKKFRCGEECVKSCGVFRCHGLFARPKMLENLEERSAGPPALGPQKVLEKSKELSDALRLRVQSRSRTRLRIAASIAFLFRACF